jgi:Acetylaranotin biosynthesis cluster protein L
VISLTSAVRANGPGHEVRLDRDAVWRGLLWKAECPMPFVPSITECTIVERGATGFVRDILDFGEPIRERVTVEPMERIVFERVTGRIRGTIRNEIEERDGDLWLRFTFALEVEGAEPGGPEEQAVRDGMGSGYRAAVETTLAAVRRVVSGEAPAPVAS